MKRMIRTLLLVSAAVLVLAVGARAQDLLVPAGTLLQCTLDEPNFSSATAAVGDPVLCHLRSFQEFGRQVFPRGSMLAGHLEGEKEPGHFVGKGYLKITFDRVIVPTGDVPLPAKVIQAKGYKVDKQGDIKGNGHATRDVVEWMIPPLWPWKVIMLPAKGPRPVLKGEEPLQLRLMDDIVVPGAAAHAFVNPNRPPYAYVRPSGFAPASVKTPQTTIVSQASTTTVKTSVTTAGEANLTTPASVSAEPTTRFTILVLKSNQVFEVTKYRSDNGMLTYERADGQKGAIGVDDVDWRKTTEMTAQVRSVDTISVNRQVN
jgi:hypothetical protein